MPPMGCARLCRCGEPVNTRAFPEVGFALSLAAGTAERLAPLGSRCAMSLPMVGQALAAGRIDLAKAKMMVRELKLAGLDNDLAHAVAARVLRQAESANLALLREHLRHEMLTADPAAAGRRHRHAVDSRRVRAAPSHREG